MGIETVWGRLSLTQAVSCSDNTEEEDGDIAEKESMVGGGLGISTDTCLG